MDINEYIKKLKTLAEDVSKNIVDKMLIPSANLLLASIKNRIMVDGKDSNDSSLTSYSAKPAYFGRDSFVKRSAFRPVGKRDSKINKNPRKTMYIETGYRGLRDIQGYPTNIKNLTYSGDMMRDYQLNVQDNSIVLGFVSEAQSKKRKSNEKREGVRIFSATREEIEQYEKDFYEEYKDFATLKFK